MPTYEFIAEDGTTIEERHSMKTCPDTIEREGKVYRRAAFSRSNTTAVNTAQVKSVVHGYNREDRTFGKGDLGAGVGPHGNPIIRDRALSVRFVQSTGCGEIRCPVSEKNLLLLRRFKSPRKRATTIATGLSGSIGHGMNQRTPSAQCLHSYLVRETARSLS